MWGAGIPTIYYGFFCNESLRLLYWSSVGYFGGGVLTDALY